MSFENYLKNKIPLGEACSFLIEFRKLASPEGAPMPAGVPEPAPAPPPTADVAGLMAAVVQNEFKNLLAYTVYAQSMKDLARNSIAEEFEQHADEELEHAEFLLRRMAVLGGPVQIPDIPAPPAASDPMEIIGNLVVMEQESIAAWQALHAAVGEDPAKYKIEEYLSAEQHHLDELMQLMPAVPQAAAPPPAGAPPMETPPADTGGASVKVDMKPGGGEKIALSLAFNEALSRKYTGKELAGHGARPEPLQKTAFAEKMLRGTEGYYSDRMLSVLQGLPAKVYTPEGSLDGVTNPDMTFSGQEEKRASAFKRAADEMMGAPMEGPSAQPAGGPSAQLGADPAASAYLQNEMQGQEAQEQATAEYYKQRFQEAQQQLESVSQQQEQQAQQTQQLQQQAEQTQLALSSSQNQAQQATAMAMQQVMQAGDEKLQEQMQSAQMRMAFQQLRGQLIGLASQEPPPPALTDPAAQGASGGAPAPGAPSGAPAGDPAAAGQPATQDPSAAPAGQPADPAAAQGQPPEGSPPAAEGAPPVDPSKGKGATSVTVKQGSANKKASIGGQALGAGIGALVGGAGTAYESSGHGDSMRGDLQKKISVLEQDQSSFPQAMRLVASKALLQGSEAAKTHPVGATIMGSLAGAGIGAATQPAVRSLVESGRRLLS